MPPLLMLINCVNPKRTEEFLLSQDYVIDASVRFESGELCAYVTVQPDAPVDTKQLCAACALALGENHVPEKLKLISSRSRSA